MTADGGLILTTTITTIIVYPSAPTNTFAYNGFGARVQRVDNAGGTRNYLHDGLAPGSDVIYDARTYTPGVSERSPVNADLFYNQNGLGNDADMTDASGNLLLSRSWDAYGNQKTGGVLTYLRGYGAGANYEEDIDSGLKLCGHRYYDPSVGRFLTTDPAMLGANWYAYCCNSPTNALDPTGLRQRYLFRDGSKDMDRHGGGTYMDPMDMAANCFGAWGGALTFHATGALAQGLNNEMGLGEFQYDHDSLAWKVGTVAGTAQGFFMGGGEGGVVAGAEEAEEGATAVEDAAEACEGGCFVAGTQVLMADGSMKPIEEVRAGEKVLSRSGAGDEKGKLTAEPVLERTVRTADSTLTLKFDNDETVTTTDEHPFYVKGEGFTLAGQLKKGDAICESGSSFVHPVSASETPGLTPVYNLDVKGDHTYFVSVGRDHLWVHNDCPVNELTSAERRTHILDGDATGGGHRAGPVVASPNFQAHGPMTKLSKTSKTLPLIRILWNRFNQAGESAGGASGAEFEFGRSLKGAEVQS